MGTRNTAAGLCAAIALFGTGSSGALAQNQEDYGPTAEMPPAQTRPPTPANRPTTTPAGPIASTDGEQPGMLVDVTALARGSGNLLTLRLSLINDSAEPFTLADRLRLQGSDYNISGIYLLDTLNKKKYHVIMGADGLCVCSSNVPYTVEAGDTINLWAKFPAPPAGVTEVGIVVPHFIPMDAVPIAP